MMEFISISIVLPPLSFIAVFTIYLNFIVNRHHLLTRKCIWSWSGKMYFQSQKKMKENEKKNLRMKGFKSYSWIPLMHGVHCSGHLRNSFKITYFEKIYICHFIHHLLKKCKKQKQMKYLLCDLIIHAWEGYEKFIVPSEILVDHLMKPLKGTWDTGLEPPRLC